MKSPCWGGVGLGGWDHRTREKKMHNIIFAPSVWSIAGWRRAQPCFRGKQPDSALCSQYTLAGRQRPMDPSMAARNLPCVGREPSLSYRLIEDLTL